jgi:sugar lactone lactonase YvrE
MKPTRAAALLISLALLTGGCASNAIPTNTAPGMASRTARALPSPFTVIARYTAASLGLSHPDSLAIGPNGDLYVTDVSQRVTVISLAGKVLRRWGRPGHSPGQFRFANSGDPSVPTDIAAKITVGPDGDVYVADSGNYRIQVFTPRGRFVRQFGTYGTGRGQFFLPFDVAVDGAGNTYVSDGQSHALTKFSPTGKVVWTIGGALGDPDLAGAVNFTSTDAHGRLVAVNDAANRVVYIDSGGHKVDAFSPTVPNGAVCEVTVDAAGNSYVSGCGPGPDGPTLVYDPAHRLIAKWPGTRYSLLRSPVFGPHGEVFALATDGSILRLRITLPGA